MNDKLKKGIIVGGIALVLSGGVLVGDLTKNEISKDKLTAKYEQATEIKTKYQVNGASLKRSVVKNAELDKYKGEPKDKIEVILGDVNSAEFTPDIEMKRWNEVSFKLKPHLVGVATKDKDLSFIGEKVRFKTPKMDFEMFDVAPTETDEGSYKYIWYLNVPPATNKIEFDIETSGLDFFYQPALNVENTDPNLTCTETQCKDADGNVVMERPENVVGSYAVYHQTKGGMNDISGKEYKTGKAFHIYRPHIIDANGAENWGNLHIENGIYSVEIPQDFLDNAVYPIKSNDTFGYTTIGVTDGIQYATVSGDGSQTNGAVFNLSVAGTVSSMTAYTDSNFGTQTIDTAYVIYRYNSAGTDSSELVALHETLNLSTPTTDSWKTINFSSESLSADDYVLSILGNGEDATNFVRIWYDSVNGVCWYSENTTGAGSYATRKAEDPWNPTTIGSSCSDPGSAGRKFSIYATYTPSGGEGGGGDGSGVIIFDE